MYLLRLHSGIVLHAPRVFTELLHPAVQPVSMLSSVLPPITDRPMAGFSVGLLHLSMGSWSSHGRQMQVRRAPVCLTRAHGADQPVGRAADSLAAAIQHMRIDHRCFDIPMPQQLLTEKEGQAGLLLDF
jgi:hypothetical protein